MSFDAMNPVHSAMGKTAAQAEQNSTVWGRAKIVAGVLTGTAGIESAAAMIGITIAGAPVAIAGALPCLAVTGIGLAIYYCCRFEESADLGLAAQLQPK